MKLSELKLGEALLKKEVRFYKTKSVNILGDNADYISMPAKDLVKLNSEIEIEEIDFIVRMTHDDWYPSSRVEQKFLALSIQSEDFDKMRQDQENEKNYNDVEWLQKRVAELEAKSNDCNGMAMRER